jgi:hypothetical protein
VEPEDFGLAAYESTAETIAGDGFDANVCADVYNLYVKINREACIVFVGNSFTVCG